MKQDIIFLLVTELERRLPFYLTGVGCSFQQPWIRRDDGYPDYVWLQTRSGVGHLTVRNRTFTVTEGMGILLFPGVPHQYGPESDKWIVDWMVFDGDRTELLLRQFGIYESGAYDLEQSELLASSMEQLLAVSQEKDQGSNFQASGLLYNVLLMLLQRLSEKRQPNIKRQHLRLQPIFDYVEEHYQEPIGLEELADRLGVTPEYFCLLFKQTMQMRPFDYVNRFRIEKSKQLLVKSTDMTVEQIARQCGYDSLSYFFTKFKKVAGMTPGEFREAYQRDET